MDKPFGKLICSSLFTFHIGPEKVPFVVSSHAIAKQSPALDALINSNMMEAHSRTAAWPDVDEDTFVRFCEFCYLNDYSPPSCVSELETHEEPAAEPPELSECEPDFDSKTSRPSLGKLKGKKKKIKNAMRVKSITVGPEGWSMPETSMPEPPLPADVAVGFWGKRDYPLPEPSSPANVAVDLWKKSDYPLPCSCKEFTEQFLPFSNVSEDQDFIPVFLGHAQLYVLADKYCIKVLKDLVLHKLFTTLAGFTIFPKRVADIAALIRFTYQDDNTRGQTEDVDPLRKLVTHYVAEQIKKLATAPAFLEVMGEGGDFVTDIWKVVWEDRAHATGLGFR